MSREMKDSGLPSFGIVPKDWKTTKLKNILLIRKEKSFGYGHLLSVYLDRGVISYDDSTGKQVHKPSEDLSNYQRVYINDFVLNNQQAWRGSVGVSQYDGIISPAYYVYQLSSDCIPCYMNYVLRDKCMVQQYEIVSRGVGSIQRNLFIPDFKTISLYLPSPTEQQQIVHFLDSKCTAIDTAIEKTKKSIEKLEEYKKAVITKAVTKGIDPNARMKDSHFLWLTAIPENWGIYKLNHILDYNHPYPLGDGDHGSIKADSYVSSGIPFIRVQNLGYAEPINIENVVYITEAQNQKIQNSTLAPNDILFAKTGATIGKTAIMPQTISRANTTSHIGKITVDTRYYVPKYIFYALSSEIGNHQLWSIANKKATRPEVGLDEVKYIKLCIPLSVNEQKQIADFLDEKLNQINNAISNHANLIRKLEEYKKSLIYYAVTGKIDCRGEEL